MLVAPDDLKSMSAINGGRFSFWQRFVTCRDLSHSDIELRNLSNLSSRGIVLYRGHQVAPICPLFIRGSF
jgi:hypothetical protein